MKQCIRCLDLKDYDKFIVFKDGLSSICIECKVNRDTTMIIEPETLGSEDFIVKLVHENQKKYKTDSFSQQNERIYNFINRIN